jgi:peptidoglycan/xylan/chitin deacetylase (PgdA/CDA1 family)
MLIERTPAIFRSLYPGAVWRLPQQEKTVYLTFDDGPIPEVTPFVLDLLDKYGIKATFFCVGENVFRNPDVYERIIKEGHQVGNHTYNHLQGFKCPSDYYIENVEKAAQYIKSPFFRPPHGQFRFSQISKLKKDYKIILWDVITRDYNRSLSGESVLNIVKKYARNGSIIVFHDSLKAEKNIKYALPRAIDFLLEEGYRFDLLNSQLIDKEIPFPQMANEEILPCGTI